MQRVINRRQPLFQLGRRHDDRRDLVTKRFEKTFEYFMEPFAVRSVAPDPGRACRRADRESSSERKIVHLIDDFPVDQQIARLAVSRRALVVAVGDHRPAP